MAVNVKTSINTADGSITTGPAIVYGILAAAAGTGGLWQLNDSSDDSGTDLISGFAQPAERLISTYLTRRYISIRLYVRISQAPM